VDTLTHTLLGVGLARAGLARRVGRGTTLVLALAANLPDVDGLFARAAGIESYLVRRVLTHSVFVVPILAAAGAGVLRIAMRRIAWRSLFGLCLLGAGVHVLFDLVNSYGVLLYAPFSRARPELAWVFIIDLAIWAMLLGPLALSAVPRLRARSETIWRVGLAGVALYVLLCGLARARAAGLLERVEVPGGGEREFSYVFPEALGPHRFRGVIRSGGVYHLYLLHVATGRVESRGTVVTEDDDPLVQAVRVSEEGRALDAFFKAPVWRVLPDTGEVEAYDLRFRSLVLSGRRTPFVVRLTPAETNR